MAASFAAADLLAGGRAESTFGLPMCSVLYLDFRYRLELSFSREGRKRWSSSTPVSPILGDFQMRLHQAECVDEKQVELERVKWSEPARGLDH